MTHLPAIDRIQNLPKVPCAQNTLISQSALSEIESAFWKYGDEVLGSYLSDSAKASYIGQVSNFLRWLKGDFVPGCRKDPYPMRRKKDLRVHAFNPGPSEK